MLGLVLVGALSRPFGAEASLNFLLSSTDRVSIPSSASINNLAAFTYIFWIYPNSITATKDITSRVTSSSGVKHLRMIDGSGNLEGRVRRTTAVSVYTTNDTPLVANTWTYAALTWDVSAAAGQLMNIYHGTLTSAAVESTYSGAVDGSGTTDNDNSNLFIGSNNAQTTTWPGRIAFFGMWNRVLTLGEIRDQQFNPHPTQGNVVFMHLGFSGGTGTQPDWSGKKNNATTVTGATLAPHVPLPAPFAFAAGDADLLAYNPFKMDRMLALRNQFDINPTVIAKRLKFYF